VLARLLELEVERVEPIAGVRADHLDGVHRRRLGGEGERGGVALSDRGLYHLEHSRTVDWDRPDAPPAHLVVPLETFLEDASKMLLAGKPTVFNEPSWGLGDLDLPEATLWW
jgi:hypothetical protein